MHHMKIKFVSLIIAILMGLMMAGVLPAASYDPKIYQAQKALKARGYNPGQADGLWGRGTQRALERFQRDSGLAVTGRLDEASLDNLGIGSRVRSAERAIRRQSTPQERRHALVIGNGNYRSVPLKNPVNDARDMAGTLKRLGFDVVSKLDARQEEMEDAIYEFSSRLKKGGVGLFYYAGHGIQVNGRNYLIPVDAVIRAERDIKYKSVDAGQILDGMYDAGNGLNIVLLDACRDNPFARSFRSSSQGLARMDAPTGTFIAYATAPGATAADGTGRNGVFTRHMLRNMNTPGLKIEDVLKQVRIGVIDETGKRQVPWQASSLTGDFYFASSGAVVESPTPAPTPQQEAGGAFLSVESNISGAAVYVDGRRKGATPISDISVSPGAHRIRVEKPGYEPYQRKVRVDPGRTVSMYVDLSKSKPAAARLFVTTTPENARVRVLNIGTRFHQGIELDAGKYQLEVSADGYDTKKMSVFLGAGEDKNLNIRLDKEPQGTRAGETWTDPATGMEFVWVPGGCYQMGQTEAGKQQIIAKKGRDFYEKYYTNELPVHEVCVDGFWMGKYEVTNAQYRQFKTGHDSKDYNGKSLNGNTQPAVFVSWNDAKAYAKWLSRQNGNRFEYRLPTEAEWEYAARAGTSTARYWGDDPDDACGYANVADQTAKQNWSNWTVHNCGDGYAVTSPVGRFQPNDFGLYDMLGNVWEWCEDIYSKKAYGKHQRNNPIFTGGGTFRVLRGGGWSNEPRNLRSAYRISRAPGSRDIAVGFRLLRPVK